MSLTPAVLDALLAAGATADMIVAAVKADMAEAEARKVEKRAGNAERQRRFKAKRRGTPDNASNALPDVTPPNDIGSNPPEVLPSEAKASLPRRGKATRLPDDWQPEPLASETAAMVSAWPVGMIERELSKFKDYWKSANGRKAAKLDWQAAWRFWLTNADDWTLKNGKSLHGGRSGRDGSGGPDLRNGFERACDRLIERAEAGRSPDGGIGSAGQRALAPPGTV